MNRNEEDCKPLEIVRNVGFDSYFGAVNGKCVHREKIFFVDERGNNSFKATPEAIREAIDYLQNQVNCMKDYLDNGCNNNTSEWTVKRVTK